MSSRTSESHDAAVAHHPGHCPAPQSFAGVTGLGQSHDGFFSIAYLWLHVPKSKRQGLQGCCSAPSRRSPAGVCWKEGHSISPSAWGLQGLIAHCHQTPWGEPLQTGMGSPGNKIHRFVAGSSPVQSRIEVYVSNLCYMS